jgi:6-phosphogluconolactonase
MNLIRLVNFGSSVFLFGAMSVVSLATAFAADAQPLAFVGTYTTHGSKGIYAYKFDAATGKLISLGLAAETPQPSFVIASRDGQFLYAANEMGDFGGQKSGAVSAFAIEADGKLKLLNQLASRGADPAHITLDRTGKYLIATNYTGGNITVFPIEQNGGLGQASDFIQHKGSSVNRQRQEGPHPHEVVMSPDNRFVLVPDLGLDEIVIYPFDAAKGKLGTSHAVKVASGSGPRHIAFSKDGQFVYLMTEMASTVVVYSYDKSDASLKELQTISSLPADFKGENGGAEIELHPTGQFLYVSNRGDNNSIAVFAIDPKSGKLKLEQIGSTQGKTPRHFAIDSSGKWLLAENQDSDNIVTFKIDAKSGHLTTSGEQVQISSPTCIEFVRGR